MATPPEAKALPDPPSDGISSLTYLKDRSKSLLASTSWDGSVRVHETGEEPIRMFSHMMDSGPLLSLADLETNDQMHSLATGGMDGSIRMVDLQSSTTSIIGQHSKSTTNVAASNKSSSNSSSTSSSAAACSCLVSLAASSSSSLLASAGWHKQLHIWDIRQKQSAVSTVTLPGKAFAMDLDPNSNRLVVACSGRRTCFVDVRQGSNAQLILDHESLLKYQLRCVRFFPDGTAIAAGSVEGRVGVEHLEEDVFTAGDSGSGDTGGANKKPKKNYAFKCHRSGDVIYPVNCIEFHPRFGTFATGGCDGCVCT